MYLATLFSPYPNYHLRQSVEIKPHQFSWIPIFSLGRNPADHFEIIDERVIVFHDDLLEAVTAVETENPETVLEELLRPFFPRELLTRTDPFNRKAYHRPTPLTDTEKEAIRCQIHEFDRRRLYFLRYGAVDQTRIHRMHEKCCRPLLGQSRDEREYYFAAEEKVIQPGDYLRYMHGCLQLHRFFKETFGPTFPEALSRPDLSDHFVDQLCRLNHDRTFWQLPRSQELPESLHPHLVRYLIMFFDFQPASRSFNTEFARQFMGNHRRFRWPERTQQRSDEKAKDLFGHPLAFLKKLSRKELARLFRNRAKELHPDRGGEPADFIELTDLYNELSKKSR